MGAEEYLTIREVADEMGRVPQLIRTYIKKNGLPAIRRGVQLFVSRSELEAWKARPDVAVMLANGDRLIAARTAAC